jgi:hypothetical protein
LQDCGPEAKEDVNECYRYFRLRLIQNIDARGGPRALQI